MGSLSCEKVVGQVHWNSAKQDWCSGGVEVLVAGELVGWLHIVEGLQRSLHKRILGHNQLFEVDIVVGVVVVTGLAIALVIPCVHHLMVW
jgi:hypothetical protein